MERNFTFAYRSATPSKAGPLTFVASTPGVKRDGKDLDPGRWNLENYKRNPVVLWSHMYFGQSLPIGRSDAKVDGKQLKAAVTFDQADDFARQVERNYRDGFLNAVSVGWLDMVRCGKCNGKLSNWESSNLDSYRKKCPHCQAELTSKTVVTEYDLLDISAVNVPGDPQALLEGRSLEVAGACQALSDKLAKSISRRYLVMLDEARLDLELLAVRALLVKMDSAIGKTK